MELAEPLKPSTNIDKRPASFQGISEGQIWVLSRVDAFLQEEGVSAILLSTSPRPDFITLVLRCEPVFTKIEIFNKRAVSVYLLSPSHPLFVAGVACMCSLSMRHARCRAGTWTTGPSTVHQSHRGQGLCRPQRRPAPASGLSAIPRLIIRFSLGM